MEKELVEKIANPEKVAYDTLNPEEPTYFNDRINILDDKESKLNTWEKVKNHMKLKYSVSKDLFFVCHKEDDITGKPQLIEENRKRIVLSVEVRKKIKSEGDEKDREIIQYKFLDDNLNRRDDGSETKVCSFWFWIYRVVDDSKEYVIFSERRLTPDLYNFRGMKIILNDSSELTKTLKSKSLTEIFISLEEKPAIQCLTKKELIEHMKLMKETYNLDSESFRDYLFTNDDGKIYSHTEKYSKIIISFLLSGKYEGYPLNLLVIGPAGIGKTTKLECINNKFQEEKGIFEAGNSTLKGLIPSFREKPANPGYILNCIRIGLIDELFKMIEGVESGKYVELLTNYFSKLNMLLEHKERTIGSGCDTIKAKSTCKLMLMTNPYRNKKTLYDHVGLMDVTTLSRFITLIQDNEERQLVARKDIRKNTNELMTKEEFLTIFDSCQNFLIDYDEEEVKKIYMNTIKLVKGSMVEVWKARGLHHVVLLLDGFVKFRCLFSNDERFEAGQEDYKELLNILIYIIQSWDCRLQDWGVGEGFN